MSANPDRADSYSAWAVSLAFWLTLLFAAALFGLVALSPKLLTYIRLRQDHHVLQMQLVSLDHKVSELRVVTDALQRDPDFLKRLANVDFGATGRGEERVVVDEHLQLDLRDHSPMLPSVADVLPWYGSLIQPFAREPSLRGSLLVISAAILIFGFTFLPPALLEPAALDSTQAPELPWASRYQRPRS